MLTNASMAKLVAPIAIIAAPFVTWFALYVAARRFSLDLHPVLPWLSKLQWVAWGTTVGLFLLALAPGNHHIFPFACASSTLSPALSIAQRSLLKRFAADLMTNADAAAEWWPNNKT